MLVMGGGRVAPNPSNEVDIYDPGTNAWTTGSPVPAFTTARRNFPTDTDGTTRIWLAGGYDSAGVTRGLDGNLLQRRSNSNANTHSNGNPTATATPTATPTGTATPTATPTATSTPSGTPTATPSATGDCNADPYTERNSTYSNAPGSPDTSASPVKSCISSDRCFADG